MFGREVDHAKLASDTEELRNVIRTVTGRTDLILEEPAWVTDFRPSTRMANKFGSGRVFIAGGKLWAEFDTFIEFTFWNRCGTCA